MAKEEAEKEVVMVKVTVIATGVSLSGADIPKGKVIEISEKSAASLIKSGHAQNIEPAAKVPDHNAGGLEATEAEKQAEALDGQYKRDELYTAAKEAGVDMAYDAKKPEIIAAVIAQGFAAALIK
jgi:hypothetical protein